MAKPLKSKLSTSTQKIKEAADRLDTSSSLREAQEVLALLRLQIDNVERILNKYALLRAALQGNPSLQNSDDQNGLSSSSPFFGLSR